MIRPHRANGGYHTPLTVAEARTPEPSQLPDSAEMRSKSSERWLGTFGVSCNINRIKVGEVGLYSLRHNLSTPGLLGGGEGVTWSVPRQRPPPGVHGVCLHFLGEPQPGGPPPL